MDNNQFHFRICVGEIEVEASGPEAYVKEMREYADKLVSSSVSRLKTLGAVIPTTEVSRLQSSESTQFPLKPGSADVAKEESIVEFLERLPNKTHLDKILAFAYYLEKGKKLPSFGVKEINDRYDEAKEAKSNTAQYFALLVKSGLIMKAKDQPEGGAAQYVLTRKGEKSVASSLTGDQTN